MGRDSNSKSASVSEADARPCNGRRVGRKSSIACVGIVAGLSVAITGSTECARGYRATGGPRQMSTHQPAYAHDESGKLIDSKARSGVRDCHSANSTLSGQTTEGRGAHQALPFDAQYLGRGAARGDAALDGSGTLGKARHMRGTGA
jgi:hypothetical protein